VNWSNLIVASAFFRHIHSGTPGFTDRGIHALVGIIVGGWPNYAVAVAIAPNYAWIKETMEKLGGS
jgi:hypothetical protein